MPSLKTIAFFLMLIVPTSLTAAQTLFCKGKWCLPNRSSGEDQIDILIRRYGSVVDMRTWDIGQEPSSSILIFTLERHSSRRVHPNADCYLDHYLTDKQRFLTRWAKDDYYVGFGICKEIEGSVTRYYVGGLMRYAVEADGFVRYRRGGKGSIYSIDGDYISTIDTRGKIDLPDVKTLPDSEMIESSVFQEFKAKLENPCWYGDCQNGFGVKWKDEKIYAGEWENGRMIVSYDSRGRPKDDLRYSPQVKKLLAELTKEYGKKPERVSGGWCYSGTCKSSYGVWANKDGDVYKGFFAKSRRSGAGRLTKLDGYSYVGSWLKGKPHGEGVETDTRGNVEEGKFFEGKKSGNFKVTYRDGSTRTIVYKNDEAIGFGSLTPAPN